MNFLKKLTPFTLPFLLVACGNDDIDSTDLHVPDTYEFRSLTDPSSESSVKYKEIITRRMLIKELDNLIGSEYLQTVGSTLGREAVIELLNRIYKIGTKDNPNNLVSVNLYNDQSEATPINGAPLLSGLAPLQTTFAHLTPDVNLQDTMPGLAYDLPYRNADNTDLGVLIGWKKNGVNDEDLLPDALIQQWFERIAILASDDDETSKYSELNLDYKTLVVQFLSATLFYPQVARFHLNEYQGLLSDNSNTNQPYTELQHQWDLAFGHYGLARDAKNLGVNQIIAQADNDSNGDGKINLYSEYNYSFSQQAALKDMQATFADTNYLTKTLQAYLTGRQLIDLNYSDSTQIQNFPAKINVQASNIITNWENSQAATMVQYINALSQSAEFVENPIFDSIYARQWASLKTLAVGLQFNLNGQLNANDLTTIHDNIGIAPIFDRRQIPAHIRELYLARTLLQTRFNFSEENMNIW
jgi:hypothetical protein